MKLSFLFTLFILFLPSHSYAIQITNDQVKQITQDASQGNANAQNSLALMFFNGDGVTKDFNEATKWFQKSADQGNANAIQWLPTSIKKQAGRQTIEIYQHLAKKGNASSQIELGNIYHFGRFGTYKSGISAISWYQKAADQGNIDALVKLGDSYKYGSQDLEKNINKAKYFYQKAAELNNPMGQFNLGTLYRYGEGVEKNLTEAKKWIKKAALQDTPHAIRSLDELNGVNTGPRSINKNQYFGPKQPSTSESILALLMFFPIWWLAIGYLTRSSPAKLNTATIAIIIGGFIGFFIAFAMNGGAGGSSTMSSKAWQYFLPYTIFHNIIIAFIILSGKPEKS